jgi:hypothetical protein
MKASKFSDAPKVFTLKHGSDNVPLRSDRTPVTKVR